MLLKPNSLIWALAARRSSQAKACSGSLDCAPKVVGQASLSLQVSGFPNMTAIALEDATGRTYIKTLDFLKVGVLSSVLTFAVIISVGYLLMAYVTGW